jgi:hypothetical protein
MVPDVAAPLTVSAVNIVSRTTMPEWHDMIVYAMTALGYGADLLRFGGDYMKNIGVSSLPLTVDKLYERIKGQPVTRPAQAVRRVAQPIRRSYQPEFETVSPHAF